MCMLEWLQVMGLDYAGESKYILVVPAFYLDMSKFFITTN